MKKLFIAGALLLGLVSCSETEQEKINRLELEQLDLIIIRMDLKEKYLLNTDYHKLNKSIDSLDSIANKWLKIYENSKEWQYNKKLKALDIQIKAYNDIDFLRKKQDWIIDDFNSELKIDSIDTAYKNKQIEINRLTKIIQTK